MRHEFSMTHDTDPSQESNTRHPSRSRYAVFATAAAAVVALATMAGCSTTKPAADTNVSPAAAQTLSSAPAAQPSTQSPAAKNPTVPATLAANGGGLQPIWNPWSDKVYHPGFVNAIDDKSTTGRLAIQPAQYKVPAGTDTFVLVPLRSPAPKWYSLAPGAKLYVSATWTGLPRPADGTDFAPATFKQFVSYVRTQTANHEDFSPEVWFVLNSKGQITLLFQVYHP